MVTTAPRSASAVGRLPSARSPRGSRTRVPGTMGRLAARARPSARTGWRSTLMPASRIAAAVARPMAAQRGPTGRAAVRSTPSRSAAADTDRTALALVNTTQSTRAGPARPVIAASSVSLGSNTIAMHGTMRGARPRSTRARAVAADWSAARVTRTRGAPLAMAASVARRASSSTTAAASPTSRPPGARCVVVIAKPPPARAYPAVTAIPWPSTTASAPSGARQPPPERARIARSSSTARRVGRSSSRETRSRTRTSSVRAWTARAP